MSPDTPHMLPAQWRISLNGGLQRVRKVHTDRMGMVSSSSVAEYVKRTTNYAPVSEPGKIEFFTFTYLAMAGAAAAPGYGQVALGTKKVARTWTGAGPGPGGPGPSATCFAPSATWPNK